MLCKVFKRFALGAGQEVIVQGDPLMYMFFIEEGYVDILMDGQLFTTLGPGQHFGEAALLYFTPLPRVRPFCTLDLGSSARTYQPGGV